ncbi:alaserpin [Drosophila ficusphila]|uniref:alaserpin n=1 Tax=Drosophila ficusphila TaxID=30025 RepID=UPI0007E807F4|nr:alaserpin [Drosophila ficusphila]
MASRATILLLLLAAESFAQFKQPAANNYWANQPSGQRQQQVTRTRTGIQRSPQVLGDVEEVDFRKPEPTTPPPNNKPPPAFSYMDRFSGKLFQKIVRRQQQRNVVISPFSVHALLAMLYAAADGKTAEEIQEAGVFGTNALNVAIDFERQAKFKEFVQGAELTLATRIYYNRRLGGVNRSYDEFAKFYYDAETVPVNMANGKDVSDNVNAWVADKTRNKIRELVSSGDVDDQTQALLVNAVYFRGRWEHEFATKDTRPMDFRHSDGRVSQVAMMDNDDTYALADLPELEATALELAYKDSATSMLILLPNQRSSLASLEQQLARPEFDLNRVAHSLRRQQVRVRLPKFQIELEQDMTEPLMQLGARQMFSPSSQLTKLLDRPVRVGKVLQKAYIDVGEAGTEAAAASSAKIVPLSLPPKISEVTVDRPFVFALRTPSSVLFVGHVESPTPWIHQPEERSEQYNY